MMHQVKNLSPEQRLALEALIGRSLNQDESLVVRPCRNVKPAPQGKDREEAANRLFAHLDKLSERVKDVPDNELEALFQEACDHAKHGPG